jgi:hypothetical protein
MQVDFHGIIIINIQKPTWIVLFNKFVTIFLAPTIILSPIFAFCIDYYYIELGIKREPALIIKTILPAVVMVIISIVSLLVDSRFSKHVWLRIKEANGQECPGCQYPGTVEVGGKCTECGMDFTPEIVERWRQWWSAEHMESTLPNLGKWWYDQFRALFQSIRKLRQTRFFPSRSKPTPTPPTPNAPPPPQPDPLASKTDA